MKTTNVNGAVSGATGTGGESKSKRPAITAPVRRGARVLRECDANGRLDVSGPVPTFRGVKGQDARDLKKYFEFNDRLCDFLADQAEAESVEDVERFDEATVPMDSAAAGKAVGA